MKKTYEQKLIENFAERWDVDIEIVVYTEYLLRNTGNKYGKVSKHLEKIQITITPRQLKYFRGRMKLARRLHGEKPANMSDLLKKL